MGPDQLLIFATYHLIMWKFNTKLIVSLKKGLLDPECMTVKHKGEKKGRGIFDARRELWRAESVHLKETSTMSIRIDITFASKKVVHDWSNFHRIQRICPPVSLLIWSTSSGKVAWLPCPLAINCTPLSSPNPSLLLLHLQRCRKKRLNRSKRQPN